MVEPIVKLDTNGKATQISYNVPETTSFQFSTSIGLKFDESFFKDEAFEEPEIEYISRNLGYVKKLALKSNGKRIPATKAAASSTKKSTSKKKASTTKKKSTSTKKSSTKKKASTTKKKTSRGNNK